MRTWCHLGRGLDWCCGSAFLRLKFLYTCFGFFEFPLHLFEIRELFVWLTLHWCSVGFGTHLSRGRFRVEALPFLVKARRANRPYTVALQQLVSGRHTWPSALDIGSLTLVFFVLQTSQLFRGRLLRGAGVCIGKAGGATGC